MAIILNQYNGATRTEIALGTSYEDDFEAGELIKFLARVYIVCNVTDDGDVPFSSWVTKITEHNVWPTLSVEEVMAAHPTNDIIWDNTNPWDVSIDTVDNAEITTSIHIMEESTSTCCKFDSQELLPVTISMSHDDDES